MKIITHPGCFHLDDAMAVAILKIAKAGIEIQVERRVPTTEELENKEIYCVDIGGRYEPELNNYDHHQPGGAGQHDNIKFAACGLIAKHHMPEIAQAANMWLWKHLISAVDAADNGQTSPGEGPSLSLAEVIHYMNPPSGSAAERDKAFAEAVSFCETIFLKMVEQGKAAAAAEAIVLQAQTEFNNQVLVLEKFVPWQEFIPLRPDHETLTYVVFPSERGGFCIQQVPVQPNSFVGKKPLPESWAGLRGEALAKQIPGVTASPALFCHPGRFIGGAATLQEVLSMAKEALAK